MINNVSLLFHKTWTGAIVLLAILKNNVLNVKKTSSFRVIRNNATKDLVIQSKIAINAHCPQIKIINVFYVMIFMH